MAIIYAKPRIKTNFGGGADEFVCLLAQDNEDPVSAPSTVQISANGFLLNDATVSVRGYNAADYDNVIISEGKYSIVLGGIGSKIGAVKLSGLPAGSYSITVIPYFDPR